jgi:hypothetical protein
MTVLVSSERSVKLNVVATFPSWKPANCFHGGITIDSFRTDPALNKVIRRIRVENADDIWYSAFVDSPQSIH